MDELIMGIVETLTEEQKQAFIDYLKSLTGDNQTPVISVRESDG